ncbi:M48 family metallopeptidase [Faecalicatena contorta]|uniref:M48 family metallopeptidase n=1 Tax=Lachnospiraceae TaxID=186803 RepID=UPI001F214E56|nr:SprT family zinc-dependent metalloprotease [Faecalicatena contorta]MCF2667779.1 M48 family metallopeptidase [Faecalicatena contorta]MCI6120538.1 M48 family metallopeptidase [Lachnospiraceae bacterium]
MKLEYTVIRSNRRTIGLEVKPDGQVIVRVPIRLPDSEICKFVHKHEEWIQKHQEIARQRLEERPPVEKLTMQEIQELADQAVKVIPQRVAYYAPKIGVDYGRITIRNQKTRWGSCSANGNLNFNCLLMLTPSEVIDSVVVHELCHRKEMNHSDRFYAEVLRVFPDYWKWNRWLKENGGQLMQRCV